MNIRGYMVSKNKTNFFSMRITFLTLFILLFPIMNNRYVLGTENPKIEIIEERMNQLQSSICRWEEWAEKMPNDLYPRNELIELRKKYIKWLDKLVNQLNSHPAGIDIYEKEINLLEEKINFSIKIKNDYSQLINLNLKELKKIDQILLSHPQQIVSTSIQLFDAVHLQQDLIKIKEELSRPSKIGADGEFEISDLTESTRGTINNEISKNTDMNRNKTKIWNDKAQEAESELIRVKKAFIQLLLNKINDTNTPESKVQLKLRLRELLTECIQQIEAKLEKKTSDNNLKEELKELKKIEASLKE